MSLQKYTDLDDRKVLIQKHKTVYINIVFALKDADCKAHLHDKEDDTLQIIQISCGFDE